jgi:hypothetical protein
MLFYWYIWVVIPLGWQDFFIIDALIFFRTGFFQQSSGADYACPCEFSQRDYSYFPSIK